MECVPCLGDEKASLGSKFLCLFHPLLSLSPRVRWLTLLRCVWPRMINGNSLSLSLSRTHTPVQQDAVEFLFCSSCAGFRKISIVQTPRTAFRYSSAAFRLLFFIILKEILLSLLFGVSVWKKKYFLAPTL